MNLLSPKTIKEVLLEHNVRPSKIMGQNFLINQKVLEKTIENAELSKNDTVLEVGPGIGTLTKELAKKVRKVVAIEKDKKMVEILNETLKDYKNVEIIQGDVLKFDPKRYTLNSIPYKVVANIPYYLTSPLIRKFLEEKSPPTDIVLMVQKEVAQRICAKPPNMSLLAVSVQIYANPKIISYVKKECFWPSPKVDSAIIKITPFQQINKGLTPVNLFFRIVKAGFSHPRKQLANNLSKILKKDRRVVELWLSQNNIEPEQRAETLIISDWKNLSRTYQTLS
ncbi:MAG: 16S rRNA (adenine(1518)-N(6)/adenine(1519)-N(6))-dimethyltransferase RsmA [Patescibacteria group bacterium]